MRGNITDDDFTFELMVRTESFGLHRGAWDLEGVIADLRETFDGIHDIRVNLLEATVTIRRKVPVSVEERLYVVRVMPPDATVPLWAIHSQGFWQLVNNAFMATLWTSKMAAERILASAPSAVRQFATIEPAPEMPGPAAGKAG